MGRSIMFVSRCLSICYLASLGSSFSINYEKEKAKLRERVQHIKDPAEREEKLLQIAVEDQEEAAEKERARADKFKEEVGELRSQKNLQVNITKKIGIIYYYPVRIDHLEWLITEDPTVQTMIKGIDQNTILVPTGISPDGKESYKGRYRTWLGIARAWKTTNNSYLIKVKDVFKSKGIDVDDENRVAATAAVLFNKMSGEVKKDDTEVKYQSEDEVVAALQARRIKDEEQLKLARAIYELDL